MKASEIAKIRDMNDAELQKRLKELKEEPVSYTHLYNTHSILVTGISSDLGTIYFTDANSDNKCIIKWNRSISKSSLASSLVAVYKAPYLLLT